ncbi:integral membrane sensor signal transduction histidine kinase [Arcobacter nitrofigilis DSM 7299]|uniref:histidine kinase n=1 Tax=Arcobacter nitrofigilis (strain ATCC 33309 / DSM 7299 / CCUG 15893 / LMG 7604 / NCTC 12251 / CI) TaxID=572480 RepID=D5V1U1_ARCNC|nr:cache domain-containing protein [Arcobacter nitrofigilis]ADG93525.1 integral membrane sensor signal transduction histidine kinase [Arcobacter nitrofigilis DSM 7299]
MAKKTNVTKLIIIVPIFFIFTTIIAMSSITISILYENYNKNILNLSHQELELQKQHIKTQIDSIYNYIEYKKTEAPKRFKQKLKDRVYMAYSLANKIYEKEKDKLPKEELQKKILETLRKVRFGNTGYFFVAEIKSDTETIAKMLPATPEKEGTNVYLIKDIDNKYYGKEFVKVISEKKEGFVHYKWHKLTNNKEQIEKTSFIKSFPPYNWFIGYGEYMDDFEKNIKKEALDRLKLFKYPNYGYIWTISTNRVLLEHPYKKSDIGKINTELDKKTGALLSDLFIKAALKDENGSFVEYHWTKPNGTKILKKIGFVRYIKDWDWVIGTGVYLEDIHSNVEKFKEKETHEIKDVILNILIISIIILIIVSIISYLISKKINGKFLDYEESLKNKQYELEKANSTLENKVQEKTKELKELNEKLELKVKARTEEIAKKNKVLEEQSKMVALGEMIGNIAHQWRQPLSSISVAASSIHLKKELNILEDQDLFDLTDNIVKNTQYLSQVIDDFRNYVKGEKKLVNFDINDSVKQALNILDASVHNHKLIIIKDFEKNIFLDNYLNELIQALVNILNNAKDALKEKQKDESNRIIFIKTYSSKDKAYISIKDSAGGVDESLVNKIFEPYFTTKDKTQGTGLGLYMTYQIISDSMKGKIHVENSEFTHNKKLYRGANFIIELAKL